MEFNKPSLEKITMNKIILNLKVIINQLKICQPPKKDDKNGNREYDLNNLNSNEKCLNKKLFLQKKIKHSLNPNTFRVLIICQSFKILFININL